MQIRTTDDQREKVKDALLQPNAAWNEVVWTYLIADLIAQRGADGEHVRHLFGAELAASDAWFEAKPIPPRQLEGNTRVDLATGAIRQRGDTESGIEFDTERSHSWVGFVEAKVLSDCSTDVANDPTRNQITRVIENLLCFQAQASLPAQLYFTILTPRYFREERHRRSRLYGYKFLEYTANHQAIIDDILLCKLDPRRHEEWTYPETIRARAAGLKLHWAAYEDILACEPDLAGIDLMQSIRDRQLPPAVIDRLQDSLQHVIA